MAKYDRSEGPGDRAVNAARPKCIRCGGPVEVRDEPPRPDVAYVRYRRLSSCPRCRRTTVVDRARRMPAIAALALAVGAGEGRAQTTDQASFPTIPGLSGSVRALGLGGAYQVGAAGPDAVFHFPSVMVGAGGIGFQLQRWGGEGNAEALAAARGWRGGTVAVALSTLAFSATGRARGSVGQDELFSGERKPLAERTALLGYARGVKGVRFGSVAKLSEERVGTSSKLFALLDVGASTELGSMTVAASYQNAGNREARANPRRFRLGVGRYGLQVGVLDLGFAAELSRVVGEWVPGAGIEMGYWPVAGRTFVARAGLRRIVVGEASPLTLGFSYWGDEIVLEWSFQPVNVSEGAGTHRFGLGWR